MFTIQSKKRKLKENQMHKYTQTELLRASCKCVPTWETSKHCEWLIWIVGVKHNEPSFTLLFARERKKTIFGIENRLHFSAHDSSNYRKSSCASHTSTLSLSSSVCVVLLCCRFHNDNFILLTLDFGIYLIFRSCFVCFSTVFGCSFTFKNTHTCARLPSIVIINVFLIEIVDLFMCFTRRNFIDTFDRLFFFCCCFCVLLFAGWRKINEHLFN